MSGMTFVSQRSLSWALALLFIATLPSHILPVRAQSARGQERSGKFDSAVEAASRKGVEKISVIISVDSQNRPNLKRFLAAGKHQMRWEHTVVSAISVEIPVSALERISNLPGVSAVSFDAPVAGEQLNTTTPITTTPALVRETLGLAPTSGTGKGVGVAVIDSGIAPVADFGNRVVRFYDFTRGGISTAPYDDNGHGTHVAGLIGGAGRWSDRSFAGVAPGVNLVGLKVLKANGSGRTSDVLA